jgi:hypothetical protein
MTLYHDASVLFGGQAVGGIRISHLSDIPADIRVSLAATKGKKALHTISRMQTQGANLQPTYQRHRLFELISPGGLNLD